MNSCSVVPTLHFLNDLSNSQTETGIGRDQAFKHVGSSLAFHECRCQRAFRCSEEHTEVGDSRTRSSVAHQRWDMEDILPGL